METYELVNRAFRHLPPPEIHRLLVNRLDATPLAEFLADPRDNLQVKKLTRQQIREDPGFAEELTRAMAAPPAPAPVTPLNPPAGTRRKSHLTALATSGIAAILLVLLAVLVRKPRLAKRPNS